MPDKHPDKNSKVLITGGSGLVGRYLTSVLLAEGFKVSHLSRKQDQFGRVRVYRWDPARHIIDPLIFEGIDYIIHLAGANIGEKRWTQKRKKEIINSRVESARLFFKIIEDNRIRLKAFISASATGYYGQVTSDKIFNEDDLSAEDFLGNTCRLWEDTADKFKNIGIRTVKIRTAVVLEKNESALGRLLLPASLGIFPRLGNGRQYMPWIHIKDLCNIYLKAMLDEKMEGAYNAAAPHHVSYHYFMKTLAQVIKKPFFHPPVPALVLRTLMGEMSDLVLKGSRISPDKIIKAGYQFTFDNLHDALREIISSGN
ncbi:MAG: TIGR01777 family oxidoreductase [Bacteroidales bacterium]|nr:TIGR01777 family oxidoreductase [Bacteroidales bacterium]